MKTKKEFALEVDFSSVMERILKATKFKNSNALAIGMGVSTSTMSTWKRKEIVPYELCAIISIKYNCSTEWLLLGTEKDFATKDVTSEVLDNSLYQTLNTSIALGWLTPKAGFEFSTLNKLFRHNFVEAGGELVKQAQAPDEVQQA